MSGVPRALTHAGIHMVSGSQWPWLCPAVLAIGSVLRLAVAKPSRSLLSGCGVEWRPHKAWGAQGLGGDPGPWAAVLWVVLRAPAMAQFLPLPLPQHPTAFGRALPVSAGPGPFPSLKGQALEMQKPRIHSQLFWKAVVSLFLK